MKQQKSNSRLFILIFVGIVSAFGPFVTDFYLPALPALSGYFHTTTSMVQLSLTFSMVGLAVGQLFIGPLSDKYGRKKPLIASLVLFIISTFICLIVKDIHDFLATRLLQGLAGAGGVVISRSIASDLYEGKELTRFFSLLSSVQGLAPIFAPVLGGLLLGVTDWRGIFWVLLAIGGLLLLAFTQFRESMPAEKKVTEKAMSAFSGYLPVLRNRRFMYFVWIQAFAMGVMFTYIASSPFIFQEHFGLSSVVYGICFGLNALGIMLGSLCVIRFKDAGSALRIGTWGFVGMSIVTGYMLIGGLSLSFVEVSFFLMLVCLGMILPTSTTLALELARSKSGNASAVLGFLTFLCGGICSPLAGLGDMLYTSSILMVVCAACTLFCVFRVFRKSCVVSTMV